MALQVNHVETLDAAEARPVKADDVREMTPVGTELFEAVATRMVDNSAVPIRQVHGDVIVHRSSSHSSSETQRDRTPCLVAASLR